MSSDNKTGPFNPWPYSIVGFFAIAIVAAVAWVTFCVAHSEDLVSADYYEREVEYQKQMERMERGQSLAGRASISYDSESGAIRIEVPREHAVLNPEGVIHLYRPSEARLDRTVRLNVNPTGEQRLDASSLKAGLWDVRLEWTVGDDEFFLNEKLSIGVEPS